MATNVIRDKSQLIQLIIKKKPEYLIFHVGTNDTTTNDSGKIVDDTIKISNIEVSTRFQSHSV